MPISVPRLVRDKKTGIYLFRVVLPKRISSSSKQSCVYVSLKTRENKLARSIAAVLNFRIEMNKPLIDLEHIRDLTTIELPGGFKVSGDTPQEIERGMALMLAFRSQIAAANPGQTLVEATQNAAAVVEAPEPDQNYFSKVAEKHLGDELKHLKKTTVYKYSKTYEKFLEQFPDAPMRSFGKAEAVAFKDMQRKKNKIHTVNGMLGNLEKLFSYAMTHGYMPKGENPAADLKSQGGKKQLKRREMFYDEQLSAILDWSLYQQYCIRPDYFWGPLISLFSGLRPEEITSLKKSDFRTQDGIKFMQITDAKTEAGNRRVPVHSYLIKLGLLKYVSSIKSGAIFPYLIDGANGTKKNLSRHFSGYLKDCGVKADNNCLYSIRHTVITRLVGKNVNDSIIYMLSGHRIQNTVHYNYLHELPIKSLSDGIESLDFHNTYDLSAFDYLASLDMKRKRKRRTKVELAIRDANWQKAETAKLKEFVFSPDDDKFEEGQED